MTARANPHTSAPKLMQSFMAFSETVAKAGLEQPLLELVKIRASQINGCANCLNMHTFEARQAGESEQRLHLLAAWQDAPAFTDRERAALAWTEHMTLVADKRAPDEIYHQLKAWFSPEEQVALTLMVTTINAWNRFAVGFEMYMAQLGWKP